MIGALKAKFQGYTVPMLVMTCVNSLAVVYFAILLPFLPAKSSKAEAAGALLTFAPPAYPFTASLVKGQVLSCD